MLGWGIIIYKASEAETSNRQDSIAAWNCGMGGDKWIKENCEQIEHNGGYPIKYKTDGKFIKNILKNGIPKYRAEATIFHEDENFAELLGDAGWIDSERIDFEALIKLHDDEVIYIDSWDLS